jgi:hypothetical protein
MVFNVKKLLNVGLGLTLWWNGRKNDASGMSGRSSGFLPPKAVFASECENTDIYQELLIQHVVPRGRRT